MIRVRTWPHRDGGRVLQIFGARWQIEFCWARRRVDRYGIGRPLEVIMRRWP